MNKLSRLCYTLVNYWQLGGVCKCVDNPKALYMDGKKRHSNPHNGKHGQVYLD